MTRNELTDMMYGRGFIFHMESNTYGEPFKVLFTSRPVYIRDKMLIPKYQCAVYPDTDQFEFRIFKSLGGIELSTQKYDNIQDDDSFDRFAAQFEDSIIKQIAAKENDNVQDKTTQFRDCFTQLGEAWKKCRQAADEMDPSDINFLMCGGSTGRSDYPFDKSFDDIDMEKWICSVHDACDEMHNDQKMDQNDFASAVADISGSDELSV